MEAEKDVSSPLKTVEEEKADEVIDPLGELVKNLFDIYQRPVEVSWDGAKFGINNVTYAQGGADKDYKEVPPPPLFKLAGGHINQAVTFNRSYYKPCLNCGPFYDGPLETTVVEQDYVYDGAVLMAVVVSTVSALTVHSRGTSNVEDEYMILLPNLKMQVK
ncbi:hypothetical protein JHK82_047920 [Glycine max]|nr:hypothetical protein JHK86_047808 [Glycine max]KAG5098066.1 hypothetical protein JHK82_047920 [Glycine max]KAG5102861.1 hypothetical protein JHK84_047830 [Glycine max]